MGADGIYGGDPANSEVDATRLHLGDTRNGNLELSDSEVAWLLAQAGSPLAAAVGGAHLLAARWAGESDRSVGDVSRSYSQKANGYAALAARLEANVALVDLEAAGAPIPLAGGIRHDDSRDPTLLDGYFSEGMFTTGDGWDSR